MRIVIALPLALVGAVWFHFLLLPWPVTLRWRDPARTAFMEMRLAEARSRGETLELRHTWVPLDRISPQLRRAIIVAEDGHFYEHRGIDWGALREEFRYGGDADFSWTDPSDLRALAASLRYYRENRDRIRGRSTITQQLAKNLYLSADRSPLRKVEEFELARRLERFLEKDRIFEIYLNSAEWGPGVFGAEAAAQHYYGRSAANLTREQAAALAATLPHPLTSNPKLRPGRMEWRRNLILSRMGGRGPVETVPLSSPAGPSLLDAEPETDAGTGRGPQLEDDKERSSPGEAPSDSLPAPEAAAQPDGVPAPGAAAPDPFPPVVPPDTTAP